MSAKWQDRLHDESAVRLPAIFKGSRLLIAFALIFLVVTWRNLLGATYHSLASVTPSASKDCTQNTTLGFQQIFALVIPERQDREKALRATAVGTDLDVTILPAIVDKDIPSSEYPKNWGDNDSKKKAGVLGCFISHVTIWRRMVAENIASALVIESDADWDLRIKESMTGLAAASNAIADFPFTADPPGGPASPYGDKWDLMLIGHCGSNPNKGRSGRYYVFNDSSAPSGKHAWPGVGNPPADSFARPNGTRLVYEISESICTTGYAISLRGAAKLEKKFRSANSPIDIEIMFACADDPNLTCLGIYPQLMTNAPSRSNIEYKVDGAAASSQEDRVSKEEDVRAGNGIHASARVNVHLGLERSGPHAWRYEWEDGPAQSAMGVEST